MNVRTISVIYDGSVDGYAQGTITPRHTKTLPKNARVTGVRTISDVDMTSGGSATVELLCGAISLVAATAYNNADFTTTTRVLPLAGSAEAIDITTAGQIKVAIATADLTAGKVRFLIDYVV